MRSTVQTAGETIRNMCRKRIPIPSYSRAATTFHWEAFAFVHRFDRFRYESLWFSFHGLRQIRIEDFHSGIVFLAVRSSVGFAVDISQDRDASVRQATYWTFTELIGHRLNELARHALDDMNQPPVFFLILFASNDQCGLS